MSGRLDGDGMGSTGEDRFRVAFEHSAIGVAMTDAEGRFLEANPAYCRIVGYTEEELRRLDFSSLTHPDDRPANMASIRRILDGPDPGFVLEKRYLCKGGGEVWVKASVSVARDDRGRPHRIIALTEDIGDRKRAEATVAVQVRLAEYGRDVGRALTRGGPIEDVLGRCAEATVRHLRGAFARIWTVDEAGETLELRASAGLYTHVDGPHARVPVGRFKIGQIARDRRPHLTNAVVGDPLVPAQDWAREQGMVAFAGYPLVVADRLVGVLAMFARHELSEAELGMMGAAADEIALGIERDRAEARLHQQGEWLRVTLASIGDAVIATDVGGRVTFLNAVAEALTGWPRGEAPGVPLGEVFRIVDEKTRREVESPALRALREGKVVGLANHTILIARDGTERAIDDSAAPIRDEAGTVIGAVLIFRDVEERRGAERAIREREELFHSLADSIPQLTWMARPDGHIDWYNRRWYEYTGTTPDQMEGWGWQRVHDPEALPAVLERWRGSLADGEPFDMVFPLRGADGTFRPFLTRVLPVRGEDGRVVHWFGTNTDISDRLRIEEELRSATRAADAAKEEAESANRAKTQFLAVLSHELRTPLNPILLAASSMLERPGDGHELRPTLEMIRQNVLLQARLIDDLLDVMRIVRGKMPLHWEIADCHKLLDQAVQICRSEVLGHQLRMQVRATAARRHVNADPARLQQVFWNLIRNAVKFTPEGGGVTIRTFNPDGPDSLLVIEVVDTGIGIEPAVLPVIFDPFQQGETTITRRFGGLGLGLAICKGIVDAHGGTIVAESAGPGQGTTFRVTLRALPEPEPEDAGAGDPGSGDPEAAQARPSSLRILAVEDEPTTLRLMARLLRGLGHEVSTAGSVAEAARLFEGGGFDMIISDIGLPDGTGLDLMRRAVALRGPIPAIALTGYGMEEDIRRSREAGFTAHLTKPIDFAKLEAMIRQVAPTGP